MDNFYSREKMTGCGEGGILRVKTKENGVMLNPIRQQIQNLPTACKSLKSLTKIKEWYATAKFGVLPSTAPMGVLRPT